MKEKLEEKEGTTPPTQTPSATKQSERRLPQEQHHFQIPKTGQGSPRKWKAHSQDSEDSDKDIDKQYLHFNYEDSDKDIFISITFRDEKRLLPPPLLPSSPRRPLLYRFLLVVLSLLLLFLFLLLLISLFRLRPPL